MNESIKIKRTTGGFVFYDKQEYEDLVNTIKSEYKQRFPLSQRINTITSYIFEYLDGKIHHEGSGGFDFSYKCNQLKTITWYLYYNNPSTFMDNLIIFVNDLLSGKQILKRLNKGGGYVLYQS